MISVMLRGCLTGDICTNKKCLKYSFKNIAFMKLEKLKPGIYFALITITALFITQATFAQTKPWVAPASAKAVKNPVESSATSLKDAKSLYVINCAPCHGNKGKGDGPAAAALIPKPADHTSAMVQSEKDGSLFWKISAGNKPMPAYKTVLTETQRWELVNYIRTLAK
jgi:mono/diheme cytochrome c family protein